MATEAHLEVLRREPVVLDGQNLDMYALENVSRNFTDVEIAEAGLIRAAEAREVLKQASEERIVYGHNTGVGANKDKNAKGHGMMLLRSHAAGTGEAVKGDVKRAMMAIRLNQLTAGGSGVKPEIIEALAEALNKGLTPPIRKYGAIGTGDLTALATTALCLAGEMPWENGKMDPVNFSDTDGLGFISSNAATIGESALALMDISKLLFAGLNIAALSMIASSASIEAFAREVQDAKPLPGQSKAAGVMRDLLSGETYKPGRVQDSYAFRAIPQVYGPAFDAAGRLEDIIRIEMNSSSENPLADINSGYVYHNANFYAGHLGLSLDGLRAALYGTAVLSAARTTRLMEPSETGLTPFLAAEEAGSGLLITEYVGHSALGELRSLAAPDSLGSAVLSRGVEEHASFATQSAWHASSSVEPYQAVLASELLAATRAIHMKNTPINSHYLDSIYRSAVDAIGYEFGDSQLYASLDAAIGCVQSIGL
jgi:histidine ammonia-lyase